MTCKSQCVTDVEPTSTYSRPCIFIYTAMYQACMSAALWKISVILNMLTNPMGLCSFHAPMIYGFFWFSFLKPFFGTRFPLISHSLADPHPAKASSCEARFKKALLIKKCLKKTILYLYPPLGNLFFASAFALHLRQSLFRQTSYISYVTSLVWNRTRDQSLPPIEAQFKNATLKK